MASRRLLLSEDKPITLELFHGYGNTIELHAVDASGTITELLTVAERGRVVLSKISPDVAVLGFDLEGGNLSVRSHLGNKPR